MTQVIFKVFTITVQSNFTIEETRQWIERDTKVLPKPEVGLATTQRIIGIGLFVF
jgi:hypothetical protein